MIHDVNRRPSLNLRTDAHRAEQMILEAIEESLVGVRDPRSLALAIVAELIAQLGDGIPFKLGDEYHDALDDVEALLERVQAQHGVAPEAHPLADRLASRFFSRGVGRTWLFEYRAPFEIANALRRACEPFDLVPKMLPLMVRDAISLLTMASVDEAAIKRLVQEART